MTCNMAWHDMFFFPVCSVRVLADSEYIREFLDEDICKVFKDGDKMEWMCTDHHGEIFAWMKTRNKKFGLQMGI